MHKRGVAIGCFIILLLTVFFQLNRMDIFPKLFSGKNIQRETAVYTPLEEKLQAQRECFLLFYDTADKASVQDMRELENYLVKLKRRTESRNFAEETDFSAYKAVIAAANGLSEIPDVTLQKLSAYVENGGSVYLAGGMSPHGLLEQAGGIAGGSQIQQNHGVRLFEHALIGADDFTCADSAFDSFSLPCSVASDVTVLAQTGNGNPLLWERRFGKGKYVVFNEVNAFKKIWRGFFIAGLSRLYDDFSYPVIGAKLVFIDDFPAPVPEGRLESIYNEFKMNTEDFYRYVWWPDMLSICAVHNIKYTGFAVETYNDRVKPPFTADAGEKAKKYFASYGRELLKSGGELAIHGYNHQPLVMQGNNQEKLGYKVWENQNHMEQALAALKEYIEDVYPECVLRSYVPPANILSEDGRAAIRNVFPSVNIFCSLYFGSPEDGALIQNFSRNADNSYDIPRVSSGFAVSDTTYLVNFSAINAYGISTHFVHPDELYFEKAEKSWAAHRKSFTKFAKEINERYTWLRAATAAETANYMDIWYDFDYVTKYLENGDLEFLTNGVPDAYLLFRTTKKIDHAEGCLLKDLGHGAYLLQTENTNRCLVSFEK